MSTTAQQYAHCNTLWRTILNTTGYPVRPSTYSPLPIVCTPRCVVYCLYFMPGRSSSSPGGLSTAIRQGSPSAPWDITYCATWWNLNRNWAAYGYRKQRSVRGYGTKRLAIPRPMGESHTEERESHFLNLFRTFFLADLHNGTSAAAVSISLTFSVIGAATDKRSLVLLISYFCFRHFPYISLPKCSACILSKG